MSTSDVEDAHQPLPISILSEALRIEPVDGSTPTEQMAVSGITGSGQEGQVVDVENLGHRRRGLRGFFKNLVRRK